MAKMESDINAIIAQAICDEGSPDGFICTDTAVELLLRGGWVLNITAQNSGKLSYLIEKVS